VGNQTELGVKPEDFYLESHRRFFQAILDLIDLKITPEPVSVIGHMKETNTLTNESKDTEYLMSVYRDSIPVQPLSYYAQRIKRLSERRKYQKVLLEATELLHLEPGENETVFGQIEDSLFEISRVEKSKGLKSVKEDRNPLIDYITNVFENKGSVMGLKTHFKDLDEITTGLKSHELVIIAARPGVGKTTFAMNIATNVALIEQKTVVVFTTEMGRLEILLKMICSQARINSKDLSAGTLPENQRGALLKNLHAITSAPIYIDDSSYLTVQDLTARVRALKAVEDIGLIVVDYLQFVYDPKNSQGGRQQEVSSISRALKSLAKDTNCPVIALSQLNRQVEQRTKDPRPQLSDLRESGAIEQDADIVMFVHREEMIKSAEEVKPEMKGMAEIIVAKNRAGASNVSFYLLFTGKYSRFDNVSIPPT
jgi:replicative DNA helicase